MFLESLGTLGLVIPKGIGFMFDSAKTLREPQVLDYPVCALVSQLGFLYIQIV